MENQRSMEEVLKLQREHFLNEGPPSYELRIDRLDRVQDMVIPVSYTHLTLPTIELV